MRRDSEEKEKALQAEKDQGLTVVLNPAQPVILSVANDLACRQSRFFAALRMIRFFATYLLIAISAEAVRADDALFRERIAPIFESRCVRCHEGVKPKGGLSLVSAEQLKKGGESGPTVVPRKPDESLLLDYVAGDKPEMPKDDKPLSPDEVTAIRKWIEGGAAWPTGVELVDKRRYDFNWWSLRPLDRPTPPAVHSDWVRTPIDAFILSKLSERKMAAVAGG